MLPTSIDDNAIGSSQRDGEGVDKEDPSESLWKSEGSSWSSQLLTQYPELAKSVGGSSTGSGVRPEVGQFSKILGSSLMTLVYVIGHPKASSYPVPIIHLRDHPLMTLSPFSIDKSCYGA